MSNNLKISAYSISSRGGDENLDNVYVNGHYISSGSNEPVYEYSKTTNVDFQVYGVCDGLNLAPQTPSVSPAATVMMRLQHLQSILSMDGAISRDKIWNFLLETNSRIRDMQALNGSDEISSTFAGIFMHKNRGLVAHLGDSRVYVFRGGRMLQITEDHLASNDLYMKGVISQQQAEARKLTSRPTASLGMADIYEAESTIFSKYFVFYPGDIFVLCTDGVTDAISNDTLERIVRNVSDPSGIAHQLIDAAASKNSDNKSVIVLTVDEVNGESANFQVQPKVKVQEEPEVEEPEEEDDSYEEEPEYEPEDDYEEEEDEEPEESEEDEDEEPEGGSWFSGFGKKLSALATVAGGSEFEFPNHKKKNSKVNTAEEKNEANRWRKVSSDEIVEEASDAAEEAADQAEHEAEEKERSGKGKMAALLGSIGAAAGEAAGKVRSLKKDSKKETDPEEAAEEVQAEQNVPEASAEEAETDEVQRSVPEGSEAAEAAAAAAGAAEEMAPEADAEETVNENEEVPEDEPEDEDEEEASPLDRIFSNPKLFFTIIGSVVALVFLALLLISLVKGCNDKEENSSRPNEAVSQVEESSIKEMSVVEESEESSLIESSIEESSKQESSAEESSKQESSKEESSKQESSKEESSKQESSQQESSMEESSAAESSAEEVYYEESYEDPTPSGGEEIAVVTVQEGDTYWDIIMKYYGYFSDELYQYFLEYNGLTEDEILNPGYELHVPSL